MLTLAQHLLLQVLLGRLIGQPDSEQGFFEGQVAYGVLVLTVLENFHALPWQVDQIKHITFGNFFLKHRHKLVNIFLNGGHITVG